MSRQQSCHINYKSKLREGGVGGGGRGKGMIIFFGRNLCVQGKVRYKFISYMTAKVTYQLCGLPLSFSNL